MLLEEFNYELPEKLIAQVPAQKRDMSRMLVLDRFNKTLTHKHFCNITDFLTPNDLLTNDTTAYDVYMNGNHSITGITNNVQGEKKCLLVMDSFGCVVAPENNTCTCINGVVSCTTR